MQQHPFEQEQQVHWARYWGKTNHKKGYELGQDSNGHLVWKNKARPDDSYKLRYHLLPYHNLDVAAAAWVILEANERLKQHLAQGLSIREDRVVPFIAALMALHDIGKFSEQFQHVPFKKEEAPPELRDCPGAGEYRVYHDTLGYLLWRDYLHKKAFESADWFGLGEIRVGGNGADAGELMDIDDWWDYFDPIAQAVTGHHGAPPDYRNHHARHHFDPTSQADALAYAEAVFSLFNVKQPFHAWSYHEAVPRAKQASWLLAGLAVLADWIGSNAGTNAEKHYFRFEEEPVEKLDTYWETALKQAEKAVARTGILPVKSSSETGLHILFPKLRENGAVPTPLQHYAQTTCPVTDGPQLFVFEDATGSGKTEAAVILAHRIMQKGGGQGTYFGLPTMATANAMFGRLIDPDGGDHPYQKLFDTPDDASVILAHSRRDQQEHFRDLHLADAGVGEAYNENGEKDESDLTGQAQCAAWIHDLRKKALLAHVGVGTIDQALIGVLPSKHQSLRLLGLGTKVLIVDEVHAYDEYVSSLLRQLIAFQAAMGGNAILLTATLTQELRRKLCEAFRSGLYGPHETDAWRDAPPLKLKENRFPLATRLSRENRDEVEEKHIEPRTGSARSVAVRFFHKPEDVQAYLLEKARVGQCACWIRNTVDDAIAAYEGLKNEEGVKEKLFHARFALTDRLDREDWVLKHFGEASDPEQREGKILIATQVVEQSLDLDFDVLVSDLAPIDLLVQRVGRQHRHRRDGPGNRVAAGAEDGREPPVFGVLAPEITSSPDQVVKELASTEEKKAYKKVSEPEEKIAFAWNLIHEKRLFPQARYVYPHTGVLWRTAKVLRELERIAIPKEARLLLETVYAPGDPTESDLPDRWRDQAGAWATPNALRKASNEAFNEMKRARSEAAHNALHLQEGYGGLEAGAAHWFSDKHTPTRLGEPTVMIRLAKEVGRGKSKRLIPWACPSNDDYQQLVDVWQRAREAEEDGGKAEHQAKIKARRALLDAWQQSEVSVRLYKLAEVTIPKKLKSALERVQEEMPDKGKWSLIVPVDDGIFKGKNGAGKSVTFTYTDDVGLKEKPKEKK